MIRSKALRLIDANLNRAKEGLRVAEDLIRFFYDDRSLTVAFKRLRHDCTKAILEFPVPYRTLIRHRESGKDVGRKSRIAGKKKPNWKDILISNLKRTEESFRVLEEAAKVIAPRKSARFQAMRFQLYELEKRALGKF